VNGTFKANGATGIVVFDITAAQLESDLANNQVAFSGAGVTAFIINVDGSFTEPTSTNFNNPQEVALFNFYNAGSVTLGNWEASVLAPAADLTIQSGYLDGSVFAASFSGGGELHNDNLFMALSRRRPPSRLRQPRLRQIPPVAQAACGGILIVPNPYFYAKAAASAAFVVLGVPPIADCV
jgi:hypothetical protein